MSRSRDFATDDEKFVSNYVQTLSRPWQFSALYEVIDTNRHMWSHGGPELPHGTICFYTDGSKMGCRNGSGVFGPRIRETIPMGLWPTVSQAEVYAIYICAKTCLIRNYRHAKIGIFSDSQAALLALKSSKCDSKLVTSLPSGNLLLGTTESCCSGCLGTAASRATKWLTNLLDKALQTVLWVLSRS